MSHACHAICTLSRLDQCDSQKKTQHVTSKVLLLPRKMTEVSKVLCLPRKTRVIFWKPCKKIAPIIQKDFEHVMKHVGMSRSLTPATRNEVRQRLKPPKATTFAGVHKRQGHSDLMWTLADGCGRLRSVTQQLANTPSTPKPPEWNGNPCYAFGKNEPTRWITWEEKTMKTWGLGGTRGKGHHAGRVADLNSWSTSEYRLAACPQMTLDFWNWRFALSCKILKIH